MQNIFIDNISKFAIKDMEKTGILASLTIAQAILESGWGISELAKNANNIFGIKGNHNGHSYSVITKEFVDNKWIEITADFRKYPSWLECVKDHSDKFLTMDRYKNLIGETDYKQACINVHKAGYATAPNYAEKLISIIEQYKLYEFDGGNKMEKTIICIDAGHCDKFAGACNGSQMEHNDVLKLALIVEEHLKAWGHTVIMTRRDGGYLDSRDKDFDLNARPKVANKATADYFLSIHRNSHSNNTATGNEIWVHSKASTGTTAVAQAILNEVNEVAPLANRGVKKGWAGGAGDYAINRLSNMTSALLELSFISSENDNAIFNANIDKYGLAIATGICKGLGIKYEAVKENPVQPIKPVEKPNEQEYYLFVGHFKGRDDAKLKAFEDFCKAFNVYYEVRKRGN